MTKDNRIICSECTNTTSCFRKLITSELEFLSETKTRVTYQRGETIYKQGTFATHVIHIVEGYAKTYFEGPNNRNLTIKILRPSEFIGLSTLFCSPDHCLYSAKALTDVTVCLIEKNSIKKLVISNPEFAVEIIKWYCGTEKHLFNKLVSLGCKQMHGKLADALMYLEEDIGSLNSFLSRKDIAELAGISIESTIRILSELHNEQVIELNGREIKITNPQALKMISKVG